MSGWVVVKLPVKTTQSLSEAIKQAQALARENPGSKYIACSMISAVIEVPLKKEAS